MRIATSTVLVLATGLALAGCGNTPEERGISGAGIGASAGAILGAVTGMTVLQGAVIGAVAGGLTGAVTNKDTINMGDPVWKRGQSAGNGGARPAAAQAQPGGAVVTPVSAGAGKSDVVAIQSGLGALGYKAGPADGKIGARTRDAIRAYQEDRKLLVDGQPTPQLARHIESEINKLTQMTRAAEQVPQQ